MIQPDEFAGNHMLISGESHVAASKTTEVACAVCDFGMGDEKENEGAFDTALDPHKTNLKNDIQAFNEGIIEAGKEKGLKPVMPMEHYLEMLKVEDGYEFSIETAFQATSAIIEMMENTESVDERWKIMADHVPVLIDNLRYEKLRGFTLILLSKIVEDLSKVAFNIPIETGLKLEVKVVCSNPVSM